MFNEETFLKKIQSIEDEIDARCEYLKGQIDEINSDMKQNLMLVKSKCKNTITPQDIKSLKKDFEVLKK